MIDDEYYISGCETCPYTDGFHGPCIAAEHGATRNAATAYTWDDFPDDCPLEEMDIMNPTGGQHGGRE